jgi:tetrahedral aminopeptidase
MKNTIKKLSKPIRIQDEQLQLIEKLSNACGIAGQENEIRKIVLDEIKDYADEINVDAMGNVLAIKKADKPGAMKVMVAAHMDEVGFLITKEDEEGLYHFNLVGGIDKRTIVGKMVNIGKEHIKGIIGARPIHLTTADERKQTIPLDQLRMDTGLGKNVHVQPGDMATYATRFQRFGPTIRGKAFDDRLGVVNLIQCLKHAPKHLELQAAFTVQEEIGLRGAKTAAFALNPDIAFVLDATPSHDLPAQDGEENTQYNTRAGYGPAIYVADGATLSDPRLVRFVTEVADANQIPYQIRQPGSGGTDAGSIHKSRGGIPSISMSVPCRYIHSAIGIARISDWENALNLILAVLQNCEPALIQRN